MKVSIRFTPPFQELTGCEQTTAALAAGTTVGTLHGFLTKRFPKLAAQHKTTLLTVSGQSQTLDFVLREDDEVTLGPMGFGDAKASEQRNAGQQNHHSPALAP